MGDFKKIICCRWYFILFNLIVLFDRFLLGGKCAAPYNGRRSFKRFVVNAILGSNWLVTKVSSLLLYSLITRLFQLRCREGKRERERERERKRKAVTQPDRQTDRQTGT